MGRRLVLGARQGLGARVGHLAAGGVSAICAWAPDRAARLSWGFRLPAIPGWVGRPRRGTSRQTPSPVHGGRRSRQTGANRAGAPSPLAGPRATPCARSRFFPGRPVAQGGFPPRGRRCAPGERRRGWVGGPGRSGSRNRQIKPRSPAGRAGRPARRRSRRGPQFSHAVARRAQALGPRPGAAAGGWKRNWSQPSATSRRRARPAGAGPRAAFPCPLGRRFPVVSGPPRASPGRERRGSARPRRAPTRPRLAPQGGAPSGGAHSGGCPRSGWRPLRRCPLGRRPLPAGAHSSGGHGRPLTLLFLGQMPEERGWSTRVGCADASSGRAASCAPNLRLQTRTPSSLGGRRDLPALRRHLRERPWALVLGSLLHRPARSMKLEVVRAPAPKRFRGASSRFARPPRPFAARRFGR